MSQPNRTISDSRKEIFENYPVSKAVLTLAVPTVINQLVTTIYNLMDTYFIGKCNDTNMVAAVSLGGTAMMLLSVIGNLFGVGGGSLISRCLGAGKREDAKAVSAFCNLIGAILALIVGVCVIAFAEPLVYVLGADASTAAYTEQYLFWTMGVGALPTIMTLIIGNQIRAEGNSKHEMLGMSCGYIVNLILDPVFILVLNMGVAGAALATMISNAIAVVYFLIFMYRTRHDSALSIAPVRIKSGAKMAGDVFSVGLPAALNNLINSASRIVLNNLLAIYGPTAVAAMGIVRKIDEIPMHIATGLTQGTMPLIGYNYASKNHDRMEKCRKFSLLLAVSISGGLGLFCFVFAPQLIGVFIKDAAVISTGTVFMHLHVICLPVMAANFAIRSVFQAMGKGPRALLVAICRQGVIYVPVMLLLNRLVGVNGVAAS